MHFSQRSITRTGSPVLAAVVLVIALAVRASATPVTLTAGSDTVSVGDTFTIPVSVSDATALTSFQFDLTFDSSIIQLIAFSDVDSTLGGLDPGTDFQAAAASGGGVLTGVTGFAFGDSLSGAADSIGLSGSLTSGSVLLVQFQALSSGLSPLTLSNAFLTDNGVPVSSASGDFSLASGQVCVEPTTVCSAASPVPEPGTLALLVSGLAACGARRRHRSRRLES